MPQLPQVVRRRQYCSRCGRLMFEYFRSLDGCFGLVREVTRAGANRGEVLCSTCGARYRLLEKLDALGRPVVRT